MKKSRFSGHQIINILKEVEAGRTAKDVCREYGISNATYYGPEFIAISLKKWLTTLGIQTRYIEPGSPWENGYCESFNGKLRDNLLDGEIFTTLKGAEVVIENWRRHYNTRRPHRSLGGRPPPPMTRFVHPMGGAVGRLFPPQELLVLMPPVDKRSDLCH